MSLLLLVFSRIRYHLYLSESKYSAYLDDKLFMFLSLYLVATVHLLEAFANKV